MSEAESGDDEATSVGREIWIEKYRPQRLSEINGQGDTVERLGSYVDRDDLPHLLFAGPAGVGKCITGETPVLTNRGIERVETVVGDADGFAEPADATEVATFGPGGEFEYVEPSHVFSTEADELVAVETRDGATLRVTPEHRLLVVDGDGLSWRAATDLDAGDRVARPLSVPTPDDSGLNWAARMDGQRTRVTVTERFARDRGLDRTVLLSTLREVASPSAIQAATERVQYVGPTGNRSRPITPPDEVTPSLATFVGLAVAEARIDCGRVTFSTTSETLRSAFADPLVDLFGLDPRTGVRHGVEYVEATTRTLTHYLESVFDVFAGATGDTDAIGSALVGADDDSRAAFLRAVFDAEAHVADTGHVELVRRNSSHVTLLSYLLASLGVPSRRKTVERATTNGSGTVREYEVLSVSGADSLRRFADSVGFDLDRNAEALADHAAKRATPNHDTMPAQSAARRLRDELNLSPAEPFGDSLDSETPGRRAHTDELREVAEAATSRLEAAQTVVETLDGLAPLLSATGRLSAQRADARTDLDPLATRTRPVDERDIRTDRLLGCADGRHTPTAERVGQLLTDVDRCDTPPVGRVRETLVDCIDALGASYADVSDGLRIRRSELSTLLDDDHDVRSLAALGTVADRVRSLANEMLSLDVVERLRTVDRLATGSLYFDAVESVERDETGGRVYDLTVPDTENYVAGAVPTVVHNTTSATAIARELYGDDWRGNFLELNASDERGIDVVRDRIKNFARTSFGGYDHRIVFLDEADSLCLPPGTDVVTGYPSAPEVKPVEAVADDGEPMPSVDFETNEIQPDTGRFVDSGVADFFEVELADGRQVTASLTHPFFIVSDDGKLVERELRELEPGDEIADFGDEVGVSRCGVCGDWTAGRFCSHAWENEGHGREMRGEGTPMRGTARSDERREKAVSALSDGPLAGENSPNHGGNLHGVRVRDLDEDDVARYDEQPSEMRSGTPRESCVVDADPAATIGRSTSEWPAGLDEESRRAIGRKRVRNTDCLVHDVSPIRDPTVVESVSTAPTDTEPFAAETEYHEELGHHVRSSWVREVAEALRDAGIEHEHEYDPAFELSGSAYCPDFPADDTVIEVGGVGDEAPPHDRDAFDPAAVSDGGRRAASTAEIRSIEYSHRGRAYNVSMEDTPNFVLANGILTHNTSEAQSALRRTMEQFSDNTRFVLSCNYSSKIIDPIQSRCAVFRFSPLDDDAVAAQTEEIAAAEDIDLTDDGREALVYAAAGDMRRAINALQAAATTGETVDEEAVFTVTSTARPEEIEAMVGSAVDGDFAAARAELDRLLTDVGMAGGDVIDQLHRSAWDLDLPDRATVRLLERMGEADYRITEGANEQVQLEAMLAALALD